MYTSLIPRPFDISILQTTLLPLDVLCMLAMQYIQRCWAKRVVRSTRLALWGEKKGLHGNEAEYWTWDKPGLLCTPRGSHHNVSCTSSSDSDQEFWSPNKRLIAWFAPEACLINHRLCYSVMISWFLVVNRSRLVYKHIRLAMPIFC